MAQSVAFLTATDVAANSVLDMMLGADQGAQNIRFIARPSRVVLAIQASAALEAELTVQTQNRVIIARSALSGGATAGVMPNLDDQAFTFNAAAGEILQVEVREIAGAGTVDVVMTIGITPIR